MLPPADDPGGAVTKGLRWADAREQQELRGANHPGAQHDLVTGVHYCGR